ncbi:MAG: MmgE/PrpD family protein [Firmicutes bacterium]|nr:MmgE/PrpD family protein [Bacillota bacterium]
MTLLAALAEFIADTASQDIPEAVRDHAHKAFVNWLGVASHAARTAAGAPFLALAEAAGAGLVPVVGGGRAPEAAAALVNGALAHLDDFDDTHLATVTHPSTPVIAAAWAACRPESDWNAWLEAIAVGTEVVIRVAELLSPSHYDRGWHITASVGGIGAAAAVSRLWRLDRKETTQALALAALQPVGLRAAFGTHGKAFQVGRAAEIGWTAAQAARLGVTAPEDVLEHRRGLRITSDDFHAQVIGQAGRPWAFLDDTFKPYPSGIVTHPAIDAAIALHAQLDPSAIRQVEAAVHPLVVELTGIRAPKTGLEVKFSATGLIALGLVRGQVAPEDFELPLDPLSRTVESQVNLLADHTLGRDSATLTVRLQDGSVRTHHVEHARGSVASPLSWGDLERKFLACWKEDQRDQAGAAWSWAREKALPPSALRYHFGANPASLG